MEAYEKLLETWMELLSSKKDHIPVELLKTHAVGVFESYVHCHISPPDGCRMQVRRVCGNSGKTALLKFRLPYLFSYKRWFSPRRITKSVL